MNKLLTNVLKAGKGTLKGILNEYGIVEDKQEEFISKIDSEISIQLDLQNTQNQTMINGVPWEKYEKCIKEKQEILSKTEKYIISYYEKGIDTSKPIPKPIEIAKEMEINSLNEVEAIKLFKELKKDNDTFIGVINKKNKPRFTKEEIISFYKTEFKENPTYKEMKQFIDIVITSPKISSQIISFFQLKGVDINLTPLVNKNTIMKLDFNKEELIILSKLRDEQI